MPDVFCYNLTWAGFLCKLVPVCLLRVSPCPCYENKQSYATVTAARMQVSSPTKRQPAHLNHHTSVKYSKKYVFKTLSCPVFFSPRRFLRERRARSKSLVSRATQTIVSAWAPAAVARIRARNCADHWARPPCSRCVARRRRRRGSCAPWKRAKGRAWSPATSASPRSSCACSQASPSSSPACYSTSSWSEGILTIYRIERESKNHRVYERTEWNQKNTWDILLRLFVIFLFCFFSQSTDSGFPHLVPVVVFGLHFVWSHFSLCLCCLCIIVCLIC